MGDYTMPQRGTKMGRKSDAKQVASPVEKTCSVCGMPLSGDISFCGYCGARIEPSEVAEEKNVKSHKTAVIVLIFLIIFLAAGCTVAFFMRGQLMARFEATLNAVGILSQEESLLPDGEEEATLEGSVDEEIAGNASGSGLSEDESDAVDAEKEESSGNAVSAEHIETTYLLSFETKVYSSDSESGTWTSFQYDENGNQIWIGQYSAAGELMYYCERSYDTDGNCLSETGYYADGTEGYRILYTLNSEGSVVSEMYQDADGTVYYQTDYTYDEQGNPTGEYYYEGGTELSYQYEYLFLNGQFISYRKYNSSGELLEMGEYTYDDLGRQAVSRFYDADGSISGWVEFEYREDSELISGNRFYFADGTLSYRVEMDYDSDGNTISEKYFDADDGMLLWLTMEYISMEISVTDSEAD